MTGSLHWITHCYHLQVALQTRTHPATDIDRIIYLMELNYTDRSKISCVWRYKDAQALANLARYEL